MTQPDDGQGSAEDVQRQFAQLQAEMRRVMAEPPTAGAVGRAAASEATDFRRIEQGLDALRRDADRLRARMTQPADDLSGAEAVAALSARAEDVARQSAEIGRRAEETAAKLARAVQGNREAIEALSLRLETLAQRQHGRWLVPLAILLGAAIIGAAIMLDEPGRIERLIDRISTIVSPPKPHAEQAEPAPAMAQAPPPDPVKTAEAPPATPDPVPAAIVAAPPQAGTPEATVAATPPPDQAAPAAGDPSAPHGRIVLRAKGDSWVEVRNRQGAALLARLMRDGDSWPVPDQAALVLSTGNAGGLELLVDGTPAPALGGAGAVRRDVPLEPDLVRAGHYTPDPTARPKPTAASK